MQLMSGTEIYKRATETLVNPNANNLDLERCFNDFALLLDTALMEGDEQISTLWFHLGGTSNKRGHRALALLCFNEALKTRPDFLEAINNIGYINKKLNFGDEARAAFKKVIDMCESGNVETTDINKSEFYTNYGSMFVANGTPDEAIAIFDKAEKISNTQRLNGYNRGLAYLEKGDYERGFKGYDEGDRMDKVVNRHYGYDNLPIWDGTPGQNVVVIGEQGIGDELLFGTILPDIMKDCRVIVDAHPRLADMFRRSFPEIDVYGTRKDGMCEWGKRYKLDAKVLMGSLPKYYRKKLADFPQKPYLKVDEKLFRRYEDKLRLMSDKPKIGISWRGGTKQTGRTDRFIELEKWLPILRMNEFEFISLQYDPGILAEIEKFNTDNNVNLHHWPEMVEDYEQTAACVKNLDLIISVPQSVVHLAGVIGTITWQLCPIKTLWQTGVYGQNMPWYHCVTNFWQTEEGNWDLVLDRVRGELCNLLQMNIAS